MTARLNSRCLLSLAKWLDITPSPPAPLPQRGEGRETLDSCPLPLGGEGGAERRVRGFRCHLIRDSLRLAIGSIFLLSLWVQAGEVRSPRAFLSLDGSGWKLVGLQPGEGEKLRVYRPVPNQLHLISTKVPNDVQTAIGLRDPYGQGPEIVDINKKEWWYLRSFPPPKVGPGRQARLVFDGVDYFADVWLNGEKLGSHEGAYTRFWFDVTGRLQRQGENFLAVRVTSPWKVAGRSHYEFMKGEFDEWWDALPGPGQVVFPLGLHRSVRLEITSATRLEELQVATTALRDQTADLKLRVTVSNGAPLRNGTLRLLIRPKNFAGPALDLPSRSIAFSGQPGESQIIELAAQVDQPKLWWTWDQGPQNLYTAEATLVDGKGVVIDCLSAAFGIRTLERDSDILYKLNGRPVFLRGAWLPMSKLYPGDTDRWTYEKDLRLARHANMNHLVNYTVVEKEDFYDLADQFGILLFIEVPFNQEGPEDAVNKNYPRRDEFIRWSSEEVAKIVRSLANHPSVGVWSAVSEVTEDGSDFTTAWDPRIVEAADGYDVFVKKMEEVVKQNDPDALYFRSYCDFGERHFWNGAFFNGSTYDQQFEAQAGFVSEYGALALFPLEEVRQVLDPEELWEQGPGQYSSLALPVNIKKISYAHPWQYFGLDFLTGTLAANVDRHVRSFRDYVSDSQVYQAFLYGYSADAFRRKLFAPINGVRSWMFKSFPEKPVGGFGVIDAFDTPTMGYYAQRRTFAPVNMNYAIRYALESVPAGSSWKVPVWISNATNEGVPLTIECILYDLKGQRLLESHVQTFVPARQAQEVLTLDWRLPEEPGIYLLRGDAKQGPNEVANAEMYVKVAPRATRKLLRVLVVGTPEWAQPVADYLTNLGASVTRVIYEPTVIRGPENPFPASPEELRQNHAVIWLAGFDDYWREAPEGVTQAIVEAVESGVTFIHSGSWGSFHGGSERAAALDLTPLAQLLPVEVQHDNDVVPKTSYRTGNEINAPPPSWPGHIVASDTAPQWLRDVDFTGLVSAGESKDSSSPGLGFHLLNPRPEAAVLLYMGGHPLLVSGHYGKGRTLAYLGFSPEGPARRGGGGAGSMSVRDRQPTIVDRAIRSSAEGRLFTIVAASLLALASGEDPPVPVKELLETRATPLYETLKNAPRPGWPNVSLSWTREGEGHIQARIRIENKSTQFFRGFRLRFEGPDFLSGRVLTLWSNQYFDLLPGEGVEASVALIGRDHRPLQNISLVGEAIYALESKTYSIASPSLSAERQRDHAPCLR
jgi:beta-mannosidase